MLTHQPASVEDIEKIFGNVEQILHFQRSLLNKLDECMDQWPNSLLGDLFLNMVSAVDFSYFIEGQQFLVLIFQLIEILVFADDADGAVAPLYALLLMYKQCSYYPQ